MLMCGVWCVAHSLSRQGSGALGVRRGRVVEVGARGPHPSGLAARVGVAILALLLVAAAAPPPAAAALSTAVPSAAVPSAAVPSAAIPSAAALSAAAFVCPHHNRLALEL